MIGRLLKRRGATPSPSVPDGRRIYAIGDIHGRADLLDALLDLIAADERMRGAAETLLVFLGDYIDRGPASALVIERLMALEATTPCVFLMGNHEEVLLLAAEGSGQAAGLLARIGGCETLKSYGVPVAAIDAADNAELAALTAVALPRAHRNWLKALLPSYQAGDYLFVHAGIRPGVPLAAQEPADLRWIRNDFLDHPGSHGPIVVHGHSIFAEPEIRANRIGIDTGAYATGRLTALGLEGAARWTLSTGG